jgi:hypothetical protein
LPIANRGIHSAIGKLVIVAFGLGQLGHWANFAITGCANPECGTASIAKLPNECPDWQSAMDTRV